MRKRVRRQYLTILLISGIARFRRSIKSRRDTMKWAAPIVSEICVGMEVTSYESAEIDTFN
ncbi:coenzyme PQQ biosynthesis protein A [Methylorubrum extorquens PA1]|nr:coenzyme PQQ biosynthesis protein A [Methylorubrum extorquens PA1]